MSASPFAASLRWHRQQAGLTQGELAVLSGVSEHHISVLENGHVRQPQEPTLRALADALGVPAGALLQPPPVSPERAAGVTPVPAAALPCEAPLSPVADADAGTPAGVRACAPAGPETPGAAVGREVPRAAPGATPDALSGAEWRKAAKAALSAVHADQRRRAHAPRRSADPYRNAVPGGRKLPAPEDDKRAARRRGDSS